MKGSNFCWCIDQFLFLQERIGFTIFKSTPDKMEKPILPKSLADLKEFHGDLGWYTFGPTIYSRSHFDLTDKIRDVYLKDLGISLED